MALKFLPKIGKVVENLGLPALATIVLLPVILPVAGKVAKPVVKAVIKGGILLYEQGKGVLAEVGETLEDIVAEAKAELAEAQNQDLEVTSTMIEATEKGD